MDKGRDFVQRQEGMGWAKGWRVMLKKNAQSLTFQELYGNNLSGLYSET